MGEIVEFTMGDEAALTAIGLPAQQPFGQRVIARYDAAEVLLNAEQRLEQVEPRVPTQSDVELAARLGALCGHVRAETYHLWESTKVARGTDSAEARHLEDRVNTLTERLCGYAAMWGAHYDGVRVSPPERIYLEEIVEAFGDFTAVGTMSPEAARRHDSFEEALQLAGLRAPLPSPTRR